LATYSQTGGDVKRIQKFKSLQYSQNSKGGSRISFLEGAITITQFTYFSEVIFRIYK